MDVVTIHKKISDSTGAIEGANAELKSTYVLQLYVAGTTPASGLAVKNIKHFCEKHLQDRYNLEVIDLYQQPTMAEREGIIAAPTLIKKMPLPRRRIIGDMSDTEGLLREMDIQKSEKNL